MARGLLARPGLKLAPQKTQTLTYAIAARYHVSMMYITPSRLGLFEPVSTGCCGV